MWVSCGERRHLRECRVDRRLVVRQRQRDDDVVVEEDDGELLARVAALGERAGGRHRLLDRLARHAVRRRRSARTVAWFSAPGFVDGDVADRAAVLGHVDLLGAELLVARERRARTPCPGSWTAATARSGRGSRIDAAAPSVARRRRRERRRRALRRAKSPRGHRPPRTISESCDGRRSEEARRQLDAVLLELVQEHRPEPGRPELAGDRAVGRDRLELERRTGPAA